MHTSETPNIDPTLAAAELYLDGEGPRPDGGEALLASLRDGRANRAAFYAANEFAADGAALDRILSGVRREAKREQTKYVATGGGAAPWYARANGLRLGAAAAACLAVGYFGGMFYHANQNQPVMPGASVPALSRTVDFPSPALVPSAAPTGGYVVPLLDGTGKVVATRRFDTADEARRFINSYNAQAGE